MSSSSNNLTTNTPPVRKDTAEVSSQLKKFEIFLRDDYDPLDPSNLRSPYYDDYDQYEECAACGLFVQRVICTIRHPKGPVQRAVARFFVDKGIMNIIMLNELLQDKQD
ncbi:hypothetical protein G6F26_001567 [Rhizopus arrhizus]|nr:hypothetical protein G6F26_001567 [Rhizopus arrhizus]